MLSISKTKVCKEYIYTKKHQIPLYSLEEVLQNFNKSKNKVLDAVNFYIEKINFDKLHFVSKLCSHSDGKRVFSAPLLKDMIFQLMKEAISDFVKNKIDSVYVSESIIINISNYSNKHYISISPRIDFSK